MIKAYVLTNCQRCEELKTYMKKNNILFKELNVEKNTEALARMTMEGLDKYPVLEINGRFYSSDDVNDLKRMIRSYL